MKLLSFLFSTLLLVFASQVLANEYQLFDKPIGYIPQSTPVYTDPSDFYPKGSSPEEKMYRLKETEYLDRSGRARACDQIQGNPAAQRQCYMGLW